MISPGEKLSGSIVIRLALAVVDSNVAMTDAIHLFFFTLIFSMGYWLVIFKRGACKKIKKKEEAHIRILSSISESNRQVMGHFAFKHYKSVS